jgi:hypothetical protein
MGEWVKAILSIDTKAERTSLRHRPSELRDVELVPQPSPRADGRFEKHRHDKVAVC